MQNVTVKDIYNLINNIAPFESAMDWDNVGLLIGDYNAEVSSCIIALDCTKKVLDYAKEKRSNLIITHHPVIFDKLSSIKSNTIQHQIITENINVISAHTNLDLANGGVNDCIADVLGLLNCTPFHNIDNIGVIGELEMPLLPEEFAWYVEQKLNAATISYVDCGKTIKTVAVVGGEGSDYLSACTAEGACDAYLTGEVKHHIYCYAQNSDIQLFTAGHYDTEKHVLPHLKAVISNAFPQIKCDIYANSDIIVNTN